MVKFYICVATCLITCTILLVAIVIMLRDYLTTIRNQLWKIYDGDQAFIRDFNDVWSTIFKIRDDTSKMAGLLDKDEEEPEEKSDTSEEGWTLAPCPVCGRTAYMDYNLPKGDGYCVMCGKNTKECEHCDYGTVVGGPTRKIAADMWNKSVAKYYQMNDVVRLPYMVKNLHVEKEENETDR